SGARSEGEEDARVAPGRARAPGVRPRSAARAGDRRAGEAALGRAPALREAARPPPGDERAVPACEMVGGLRGPRRLPGPLLSEHSRRVRRLRPAAQRQPREPGGEGDPVPRGRVMEVLLIHLVNALLYASVLFLIAGGLSLIYGVMRIVNLAHGNLYAFGAYVTAWAIGGVAAGAP